MTFVPKHPTELVAEVVNRFGYRLDTPGARKSAEQFIKDTLSDIEKRGLLKPVPWVARVVMGPDNEVHFVVMPETLIGRDTRYSEDGKKHIFVDAATCVTTEANDGLLSCMADHADNIEQYLNKHTRD